MIGFTFKRLGVSALALAVAVVSLTACGSTDSADPSSSDTLTIGYDSDPAPQGFDPLLYGAGQRLFYESTYQSLFAEGADGQPVPELASSFSYNKAKTQMTLKIRSGVTFTDGSALTAELVKKNLDRRSDAKLQAYSGFAKGGSTEIKNVEAPSADTVVLTFTAAQGSFQTNLMGVAGTIVGEKAITDSSVLTQGPDGSGPYKMDTSVKGSSYTMSRKPGTDASVYPFQKIVYKPYLDKNARLNAQISGQTDVSLIDTSTQETAASNGVSLVKNGGTMLDLLVFDKTGATSKPFGNKDVRLALSYAIDRESFVKTVAKGAEPSANAFPKSSAGFDAALNTEYAFDVAKAKQALAKGGYPNGFSFTITASPTIQASLEFLQNQFKAIGVDMKIEVTTSTDKLFAVVNTQPLGFIPLTMSNEVGVTAGVLVGGFANPHKAQSPVIGAALGAAANSSGADAAAALKKLNGALINEGWLIPVAEQFSYAGYDPEVLQAPTYPGIDGYPLLSSFKPAA
ncbi:peptide/nickel transport system substrate-binding protein [Actinocorallia herbida]|uniref:Peptide/nickel transport system substrate-binding protein n=1 Tax=Actinocorallia herbida TaxID=58109 RepID=A0A3N1D2B6_9ACTN|nr:ABC transporter substrate-binding protein [Actinocorallia herbida]ROO87630.1 peptide/nickel transport system substrate-binding protein [Actinocorallia herbida]